MASRGRRVWNDPEDLERQIEEYFESLRVFVEEVVRDPDGTETTRTVELEQRPPTVAGLAHHLGVVHQTLRNYRELDEFSTVIKAAINRIAIYAESSLYDNKKSYGARFALEVNHGYGKEESAGGDGAITMKVIAPASADTSIAIPVWEPEDE